MGVICTELQLVISFNRVVVKVAAKSDQLFVISFLIIEVFLLIIFLAKYFQRLLPDKHRQKNSRGSGSRNLGGVRSGRLSFNFFLSKQCFCKK